MLQHPLQRLVSHSPCPTWLHSQNNNLSEIKSEQIQMDANESSSSSISIIFETSISSMLRHFSQYQASPHIPEYYHSGCKPSSSISSFTPSLQVFLPLPIHLTPATTTFLNIYQDEARTEFFQKRKTKILSQPIKNHCFYIMNRWFRWRTDGCVVKVSARGSEGRRFDTRLHQLSD